MKCPICKRESHETIDGQQNRFLPFCSERCKLIDLGRWLDGKYQIPVVGPELEEAPAPRPPDDPDEQ